MVAEIMGLVSSELFSELLVDVHAIERLSPARKMIIRRIVNPVL